MMFLPAELERGTKVLQFGCEGSDQNFDCGCILKKCYANLHLIAIGITGFIDNINLKCSLRATEKYPYCLEYLLFISRYGFLKLNATYHF